MHYVYILKSEPYPNQEYIGATSDLKKRLNDHNSGQSKHTAKYKSNSGKAFGNKRLK